MIKKIFSKLCMIGLIIVCILIISNIIYNYNCCPCDVSGCCRCINDKYYNDIIEWHGIKPRSLQTYSEICKQYKIEKNISFDCFI